MVSIEARATLLNAAAGLWEGQDAQVLLCPHKISGSTLQNAGLASYGAGSETAIPASNAFPNDQCYNIPLWVPVGVLPA